MLSVAYVEFHVLYIVTLSVIMLNVIMLSVVAPKKNCFNELFFLFFLVDTKK
jgi:hypothetical protein